MLIGKSGVGKSTLINNLLKLPEDKKAPTGTGNIVTKEIKSYQNKNKIPFLKLIDSRGIELNKGYGAKEITDEAIEYIKKQQDTDDPNNFVQCIWYCTTGNRFENVEIETINRLKKAYGDDIIPIIIVYTQAIDEDAINEMKNYIQGEEIKADFLAILAERME